jgi:hypothetical protein
MATEQATGYTCACGLYHSFSPYVFLYPDKFLSNHCACGRENVIYKQAVVHSFPPKEKTYGTFY